MRVKKLLPFRTRDKSPQPNLWKGLAVGAVAGLAGTWIMTQFQNAVMALSEPHSDESREKEQKESATVIVADRISHAFTGEAIAEPLRPAAGNLVHFAFGTLMGALHGAAAEWEPAASAAGGAVYGAGLWLAADEVALPLLGLADPPNEVEMSKHAYALAAHLVYGVSTEMIRRIVRRSI